MTNTLKFLTPLHGDCLTNKAGVLREDGKALLVTARVAAPEGLEITINGVAATYAAGAYFATVPLTAYENILTANAKNGEAIKITVYWLPRATSCYRLSLDDNIRFLEDIAKNQDRYHSIFENPYLAILREAHLRFGTKVHANLFYHTVEENGFTLSDMPDKFKAEFTENAPWLRFSFHAKGEFPDKPYIDTDYQRIDRDRVQVEREIIRFAGKAALAPTTTTVHWGECSREGVRALHDAGIRVLAGYLLWNEKHNFGTVSYYLDRETVAQSARFGIYKDTTTDITYAKIDAVLNTATKEELIAKLNADFEKYPQKGFWEFLMHEQYFYPDYQKYLPDFRARIFAALEWAEAHGLTPAFLSETHLAW